MSISSVSGVASASLAQQMQSQPPASQSSAAPTQEAAQPHHHHHGGGGEASAISQEMQQLGQALQSGNLTSAQQAYSTLQQDFQQAGQGNGQQSQSSSGSLSVTA